ncbi:hypothetical protein CJF32_00010641 [Rutstroemia sp. NJR-2017a WRK4]|nr:hypothetical protein CJF32_00010641 [Rutstroemia sp. NJR-2017a WRK4]
MSPLSKFTSALEATSYQSPDRGPAYQTLRQNTIDTAIAMGYDAATMVEIGIDWSEDHGPYKHVKIEAFPRFVQQCNYRVWQSWEAHLGEKFEDLLNCRHIAVTINKYTIELKRRVAWPDSLILANRIMDVKPDRYVSETAIWSLNQQTVVAKSTDHVIFFDYDRNVPADLIETGGVWTDLYHSLVERKEREARIAAKWAEEHPRKPRANI